MHEQANRNFLSEHVLVPSSSRFDVSTTALLVIDMQMGFVEPDGTLAIPAAVEILPRVNELIARFRNADALIVFTRHTVTDDKPGILPDWLRNDPWMKAIDPMLRPGSRSHALHHTLNVLPDDIIIDKFRASAFNRLSSSLDAILSGKDVETIVITGCTTNICCDSTARDGHMLGYRTIVVSDAMAARTTAEHDASLLNLSAAFADVRTTASVCEMVKECGTH